MANKTTKQLKDEARNLAPMMRIGKNGLTENALEEIRQQLKKKKLVKIKLLKSAVYEKSSEEIAAEITGKTGSELISHVGNVIAVHKA